MALRSKLIRLAHSKPELRKHLLPLLKQAYLQPRKITPEERAARRQWSADLRRDVEALLTGAGKLEQLGTGLTIQRGKRFAIMEPLSEQKKARIRGWTGATKTIAARPERIAKLMLAMLDGVGF